MKKSLIKYFGVASTTLLAVAPAAAPAVQNALNATLTNKVSATGNTGTSVRMDLSGQDEYSQLFQRSINNADTPFRGITGGLWPSGLSDPGYVMDPKVQYNVDTVEGLIQLAKLSNGVGGQLPDDIFADGVKIHASDVAKYLFTNTDGSQRNNLSDFYYESTRKEKSVQLKTETPVYKAAKFISDKIGGKNAADILGSSFFGDPNKATLKILINGSDGKELQAVDLLKQGRIVVSLVAESGLLDSGTKNAATAFISLQNSTVLLDGATGESIDYKAVNANKPTGATWTNEVQSNIHIPFVAKQLANSSNLGDIAKASNSGYIHNQPFKISSDIVNPLDSTEGLPNYVDDNYEWKQVIEKTDEAYKQFTSAVDPKAYDANNSSDLDTFNAVDKLKKDGHLSSYSMDSVVVPEGTDLSTIVSKLNNVRYNGAPSVGNYGATLVQDQNFLAYDDVNASSSTDWTKLLGNATFSNVTDGKTALALKDIRKPGVSDKALVARPGSYTIKVPVTGNVYLPTKATTQKPDGTPTYQFTNGKVFMKNFQTEATVNVVVYSNPSFWGKQYNLGTLPSFAMFPPTTVDRAVPVFYDNGQSVKETDLPNALQNKTMNITVGDSRFYDASSKTTSQNKLASYIKGAFGDAVVKKQVLISDEDIKTSSKNPIDTNNLPADVDFPNGAIFYTQRPDANTNNAGDGSSFSVDASAVDLSKAGTYDVKITYTNAKNGKFGLGSESSTITIPVTIASTNEPGFYFMGGLDQTIKTGDSFDPMKFKVGHSMDEINQMIANGTADDGVDYVIDPAKTGINVTIAGNVDTTVPGNYTLTYTATDIASGKSTTMTRTITVIGNTAPTDPSKPATPDVTEFNAIGYVNFVPGYGINVWDAPNGKFTGQRLPDMSAWKIDHKTTIDGKTWYQVGANQWVDGSYISLNPVDHMKPMTGSIKISYVPGYGVRVYKGADTTQPTEQFLQDGTEWQVFGELNGYYNVGKDQWIKSEYGIQG
ncbi:immunoglobulin-like domain-containing protein [Xylocopilactobacillus apicola]|uniref:Pesticidal crystal protein Cry22Aa Ig-like domain-containing protein n=1 Tax=Xylocopilactobacillus apicola TaxID=2932184 RepID=A0AAU9DZJ2_9LACO|nr:immunoglobulin-like domain-containing protein [Xylocopilactobacillus apicola]BDR59718.1 hypothetical protein XA3_21590 [Xylocopilactobacillus apicola]